MIRELLTPEAQRDPYAWASVLLAHAALGAAGWAAIGWWTALVYVAFEVAQAVAARRLYAWGAGVSVAACIAIAGGKARA